MLKRFWKRYLLVTIILIAALIAVFTTYSFHRLSQYQGVDFTFAGYSDNTDGTQSALIEINNRNAETMNIHWSHPEVFRDIVKFSWDLG